MAPKVSGNVVGTVVSPGMNMALELSNPSPAVKTSPTSSQPSCTVMPNETCIQVSCLCSSFPSSNVFFNFNAFDFYFF